MKLNGRLSIGQISKAAGVKVVTIRYYEKIKLMPAPLRTEGNYRAYSRDHLHRLQFIRRCRDLGFTLDRLRDLLNLSTQAGLKCAGVDRITENHLREIEHRISDLKRLAIELRRITNRCSGKGTIADCRILEALAPAAFATKNGVELNPRSVSVPKRARPRHHDPRKTTES